MIKPPEAPRPYKLAFGEAQKAGRLPQILNTAFEPMPGGSYRPWDELRRRTPPDGLTREEWWIGVKMARQPLLRDLPLCDLRGRPLRYAAPDPVTERLQRIDRDASGQILLSEEALSAAHRDRYVFSSLIEEAVMSSLLEGAATTRREAREMLRTGRPASSRGERMVLNNFHAMQRVKEILEDDLSHELIQDLHRILTEDAADAGVPGAYRESGSDQFGVWSGERLLYKPPPHTDVQKLIEQACEFVNSTGGPFVHPVIKAIALHYWIGYVHPFEDGNGRTARALFYWYLLRSEYWLFEYVSISGVLTKAYAQYARSYLYAETDDNDLTYFLLFHLDVIDRALNDVHAYIRRKAHELKETRAILHPSSGLNHRQIALLRHALHHPETVYTYKSHQNSHGVVYQTARTDLLDLARRELLIADTSTTKHTFTAPPNLSERVREAS